MTRDRESSWRAIGARTIADMRPALEDLARNAAQLAERSLALEVQVLGWDMGRAPIRPGQTEDAR